MSLMRNMNVYIVGKGPSLDRLTREDFPHNVSPIICINDSVKKVESLETFNPIYSVQQDRYTRNACVPEKGLLFISCYSQDIIVDGSLKAVYCPIMFGEKKAVPTVVLAIKLAQYFGAIRFTFLCFDSCMSGDLTQAKCSLNYIEGRENESYKTHKDRIIKAVGIRPYTFQEVIN